MFVPDGARDAEALAHALRILSHGPHECGVEADGGNDFGAALVIDHSKHLNRVLAFDADAMTVTVEPGIVLDQLGPRHPDSIALIESFYNSGKPVAAVCHAPAVLRHAKTADGHRPELHRIARHEPTSRDPAASQHQPEWHQEAARAAIGEHADMAVIRAAHMLRRWDCALLDEAQKILDFFAKEFPKEFKKIRFASKAAGEGWQKQLEGIGASKRDVPVEVGIGFKPISYLGTERLVHSAIGYAIANKRKSVTLVHKGNIMKYTEGAFRDFGYQVAREMFNDDLATTETALPRFLAMLFGNRSNAVADTIAKTYRVVNTPDGVRVLAERLRVAANPYRRYVLDGPTATLGRSKEADCIIDDPNISRKHAELRRSSSPNGWRYPSLADLAERAERRHLDVDQRAFFVAVQVDDDGIGREFVHRGDEVAQRKAAHRGGEGAVGCRGAADGARDPARGRVVGRGQ